MTTGIATHVIPVGDPSAAGEARRSAVSLAADLGFGETRRGEVAIVVTEAARNLAIHARGGELLLRSLRAGEAVGIEVLAVDTGPGMTDPERCRRDGYSTAGTSGIGLGSMERLSAAFDLHTAPDHGTVVLCRLWRDRPPPPGGWEVGVVAVPMPGETVSGDGWGVVQTPERSVAMVADGLGHGPIAREASAEVERVFREHAERPAGEILEQMHGPLRSTRGASVSVAVCDRRAGVLTFAGVGNVAGLVLAGGQVRSAVSHNGTLGHQVRKIQEFTYPFPPGSTLVMHSDGLNSQTRPDAHPGLPLRSPPVIAGVLYRDFRRGRDDATVLVARDSEPGGGGPAPDASGEGGPR